MSDDLIARLTSMADRLDGFNFAAKVVPLFREAAAVLTTRATFVQKQREALTERVSQALGCFVAPSVTKENIRRVVNDMVVVVDESMLCEVSPIVNEDGQITSTDLYVRGRGLALLVNVLPDGAANYSLLVDKDPPVTGWIVLNK